MIEILVHLANKNQIFGQQARMTLAAWDEASSKAAAANPKTSREVLDYFIAPQNLRPALLPALLENPSVRDGMLVDLISEGTKEVIEVMLKSTRIKRSARLTEELSKSPHVVERKIEEVEESPAPFPQTVQETASAAEVSEAYASTSVESSEGSEISDEDVNAYLKQHADELAAEGDKPFKAIGGVFDEINTEMHEHEVEPEVKTESEAKPEPEAKPATEAKPHAPTVKRPALKKPPSDDERRGSVLQKIAGLDIKGRIQLAMKGNKEERSILIRDGTKLVALAVLESPKITDGEVERFASQKNVLEAVLRQIPMKRRFAKLYPVVRNLVSNPRSPLDVSLGLMKHLLVQDLKNLSGNKEVSDTVRKLALKSFKSKTETAKK
jgi:hypothetical protein